MASLPKTTIKALLRKGVESMFLTIYARREGGVVFQTETNLPVDAKLHDLELKSPQSEVLKIQARLGLYSDRTLEIFMDEDGKEVLFELRRQPDANPYYFFLVTNARDLKNHYKFVKTKWQVWTSITPREARNIIYELVEKYRGLGAIELGRLFGAPIGEELWELARLGRIRKVRTTITGHYRYYPLG